MHPRRDPLLWLMDCRFLTAPRTICILPLSLFPASMVCFPHILSYTVQSSIPKNSSLILPNMVGSNLLFPSVLGHYSEVVAVLFFCILLPRSYWVFLPFFDFAPCLSVNIESVSFPNGLEGWVVFSLSLIKKPLFHHPVS